LPAPKAKEKMSPVAIADRSAIFGIFILLHLKKEALMWGFSNVIPQKLKKQKRVGRFFWKNLEAKPFNFELA
jgi:hypothetical protein